METQQKKRSTLSWVVEFAGQKRLNYILSILLATAKVLCGIVPYMYLADIVRRLLNGETDMQVYGKSCLMMALFFVLDRLSHAASTTMSHKATFEVLANVRRQLTGKLARMPLIRSSSHVHPRWNSGNCIFPKLASYRS